MGHHLSDLARLPASELEHVLRYGEAPDWGALDGWLFKGANVTQPGKTFFPKFVKGFYGEGRASGQRAWMGYNVACERSSWDQPWRLLPSSERPRPFGFYECRPLRVGERAARYPNALFLDYSKGGNGLRPESLLRDFLVQVEPGNQDLYLGFAYLALGPWIPSGFFALERLTRAPAAPPR